MALPIAQLTSAKTPEQAAEVVRSWTKPVDPAELDPLDLFVTRRDILAILHGTVPEWASAAESEETPAGQDGKPDQPDTTEDSADAQAGSVPADAPAQSKPKRSK